MNAQIFSGALLLLTLLAFLGALPVEAGKAQSAASAQSQAVIYRTSNTQTYSPVLGVMTYPALVVINNRRSPGIYVATKPTVELGKSMGLIPGMVLLSFDGRSLPSLEAVEQFLRQRSQKNLNYSYAVKLGASTRILSAETRFVRPEAEQKSTIYMQASGSENLSDDALEKDCIDLINQSRRSEGLSAVQYDSALARLAKNYTNYMRDHAPDYEPTVARSPHVDLQGRGPGERAQQAGISTAVLENIGRASRGPSDKAILSELHRQMMAEPVGQMNHRSTIMDPKAVKIGVGITRSSGRFYLAEEFGY